MAVVAGFFDSEDAATRAMDALLQSPGFKDVDTQVISSLSDTTNQRFPIAFPFFTGGAGGAAGGAIPATGASFFDQLDDDEAAFFNQALSKGGVLALVNVDDDKADQVQTILMRNGARTYEEDDD